MGLDEAGLKALIREVVTEAVEEATEGLSTQVKELHTKVIGDGENGLSARVKRSEDKITGMEATFGKIYTIASIPLGGLIMMAVNYIFGTNHPTSAK